jgi:four helix bundle protein
MSGKPYDIRERSLLFAVDVVAFCRLVAGADDILRRLSLQLVAAAGSVGANLQEAQDGQSKADFINKNCIALKECREARYWLELIVCAESQLQSRAAPLIQEANEVVAIITTIIVNAKSNPARRGPTTP